MNYWERSVYARRPLGGLPRNDPSPTFEWLRTSFPALGAKIDWPKVRASHRHSKPGADAELTSMAVNAVGERLASGGSVVHAGDSLSPFAMTFGAVDAAEIVAALLDIPEHHYFVAGDRSWVVVVTMEGDLDVVDLPDRPVLLIDGDAFDDFAGFAREFSSHLCEYEWRGNLDAFNDILRGGFGTPENGWTLRWLNSARSRAVLGYPATVTWLNELLPRVHPTNRTRFQKELDLARRGVGPTLFDQIVEIIRDHGVEGDESEDDVRLELL